MRTGRFLAASAALALAAAPAAAATSTAPGATANSRRAVPAKVVLAARFDDDAARREIGRLREEIGRLSLDAMIRDIIAQDVPEQVARRRQ